MKAFKTVMMALFLLASVSARAESDIDKRLKKIDACLDQIFQQGREKYGQKEFDRILVRADEKTDMFEDEEHCFNEKPGADLKCQARVLTAAIKVLIVELKLEPLRAQGQACEGF